MAEMQGTELKEAYWFNTHRNQVIRIAYGIAIGLVSLLWLINIAMLVRWALKQASTDQAIADLGNTNVVYDSIRAPTNLQVLAIDALSHTASTVDVYAVISNVNPYHVGKFNYTVTVNGTPYSFTDGIVMPRTSTHIVLSNLVGTNLSTATIAIDKVVWERVSGPQPEADLLISDQLVNRSNLSATASETGSATEHNTGVVAEDATNNNRNSSFATPDESIDTEDEEPTGDAITQVTACLTNASAYGYRTVRITAYLKNVGGTILGVQQQTLLNIASFADHQLTFTWQREFEFNATTEIVVETNYWSQDNLLTPGE